MSVLPDWNEGPNAEPVASTPPSLAPNRHTSFRSAEQLAHHMYVTYYVHNVTCISEKLRQSMEDATDRMDYAEAERLRVEIEVERTRCVWLV